MIEMNVHRWRHSHHGYIKIDAGFHAIFDPENQFSYLVLSTSLSVRSRDGQVRGFHKSSPVKSQGFSSQVKKQNDRIFSSKHPLSEVHESISFSLFLY
jgi:hypothetical protein